MAFLDVLCSFEPSRCHIIDAGDTRRHYKQFTILFRIPWDSRRLFQHYGYQRRALVWTARTNAKQKIKNRLTKPSSTIKTFQFEQTRQGFNRGLRRRQQNGNAGRRIPAGVVGGNVDGLMDAAQLILVRSVGSQDT
jgi:hypothetical protein